MEEMLDRIVIDPDILVGKPIIKGTRILVHLIIELLANGMTKKQILKEEDIRQRFSMPQELWNAK